MSSIHTLNNSLSPNPKQVVFRISGCEDRVMLIDERNGRSIILHRPNYCSQPDRVYQYLLQHSNRRITRKEIEDSAGESLSMTFTEIASCLNFRGELRRLFMRVSKNDICFHNPITWERMQTMQIGIEDIESFFQSQKPKPDMAIAA